MENEFNGGRRICLDCLDDSDIFRHIPTYSDIFILTVGNRFKDRHQLSPFTRTSMAWSAQVFTWSLRCSDGTENCSSRGGDRRIGTQLQNILAFQVGHSEPEKKLLSTKTAHPKTVGIRFHEEKILAVGCHWKKSRLPAM